MQRKDHPALGEGRIRLCSLHHCPNLSHPTEEDEQVSPLLRRILVVNGLEHPQEGLDAKSLPVPTAAFLRADGFIDDLHGTGGHVAPPGLPSNHNFKPSVLQKLQLEGHGQITIIYFDV